MKLKTLSTSMCQELLDNGYSHFVVKFNHEDEEFGGAQEMVTYEPVKEDGQLAIAIEKVKCKLGKSKGKYFVITKE
ncbi:MAG: hypothetical protein JST70_05530 [Bacteroidetes bacterium]|nr:hypothetical protein [Bacteroidota bacterium]